MYGRKVEGLRKTDLINSIFKTFHGMSIRQKITLDIKREKEQRY